MKSSLDISNFPEMISSLFSSVVFHYFYALFIEEGLLISYLELFFGMLNLVGCIFPFLPLFSLLSSANL